MSLKYDHVEYIKNVNELMKIKPVCDDLLDIDGETYKLYRPKSINKQDVLLNINNKISEETMNKQKLEYNYLYSNDKSLLKLIEDKKNEINGLHKEYDEILSYNPFNNDKVIKRMEELKQKMNESKDDNEVMEMEKEYKLLEEEFNNNNENNSRIIKDQFILKKMSIQECLKEEGAIRQYGQKVRKNRQVAKSIIPPIKTGKSIINSLQNIIPTELEEKTIKSTINSLSQINSLLPTEIEEEKIKAIDPNKTDEENIKTMIPDIKPKQNIKLRKKIELPKLILKKK